MKNHQQYIGFIKMQEQMLLIPIKTLIEKLSESQRQIIDRFNTAVLDHNVDVLNNQQALAAMMGEIARLMETILNTQTDKETLKAKFLSILETYIKTREAFTIMTATREKEELIAATKKQVTLL